MRTTVVVIGAGHSGLAISRRLSERSIDHVVVERGDVASAWTTGRWDSLTLLTPNWLLDLPGMPYRGDDPDGFLSGSALAARLRTYATAIAAPIEAGTTVLRAARARDGYDVITDRGTWRCAAVVVASGFCSRARLPPVASRVPAGVAVLTPMTYRRADDLAPGGVLVVGASASGAQLADEIRRAGHPVTLAVGEHVRMPRTYRGRDIFWWTDRAGILDQRHDEVADLERARRLPSPQLIGTPERRTLDLDALAHAGVRLVGRLERIAGATAQFSGSLANVRTLADLKLRRLLDALDAWAKAAGVDELDGPRRPPATSTAEPPPLELDLHRAGITSVLFATGYAPDHSWLDLPVFDRRGAIRHDGGVVGDAPGVYVVGQPVLRRRRSSYLSGAVTDSEEIAAVLHARLGGQSYERISTTLPSGSVT